LQEARDTLEKVAQLEPTSVANLLDLARVANEQNDNTGALGYLAHARELDPNNASVHFFWGIVCWEEHLGEEAYQSLKKAVTLDPNNAYYNYAIGVVTMQRGDGSESVTHLQKYCLLKPHDPRGKLAMGAAYFLSHQEEQAEKTLQHLTNDANTAAVANFYLARIAQHQGKPPEALEHIRLALQARPDYADAYAERGIIYLAQRENAKAQKAFDQALKLDPDHYQGTYNLMLLYVRTKDPRLEEQKRRFDQLIEERSQRENDWLRTVEISP
jgi:Flp pilus assembly protein TadD